jgi:hypothetical protein|tara:strand:+ start:800 stop:1039 length:240 start_codon:yes stop_codon:yes gene_type:complete
MKPKDFLDKQDKKDDYDYGLMPPPTDAQEGLQVLINHFLGEGWYTVNPVSTEQANTEAIYEILEKNQKPKKLLGRLFNW